MSFRTTLFLAAVLGGMILALFLLKPDGATTTESENANAKVDPFASSTVARSLLEQELEDVVKVVCEEEGKEPWVFERTYDESSDTLLDWQIASPITGKASQADVNRFAQSLRDSEYEVSYRVGAPGSPSLAEAGLEPPQAVIVLTDRAGTEVGVEVGAPASASQTYARVAGTERICVVRPSLRYLIKDDILEYRDRLLWSFSPSDVTQFLIIDNEDPDTPVNYMITQQSGQWRFASPFFGRATDKVMDAVAALSQLRAIQWHSSDAGELAMYGLDEPRYSIRITVREEVPVEEEADMADAVENGAAEDDTTGDAAATEGGDAAEGGASSSSDVGGDEASLEDKPAPKPKYETNAYILHLSDRGPIGEDTKVYFKLHESDDVGTILRSVAERIVPDVSAWRDHKLTTVDFTDAVQIEFATEQESATWVRRDKQWYFADTDQLAQSEDIEGLLTTLSDLEAVVFVDDARRSMSMYGFDAPARRVDIQLPGTQVPLSVILGDYTDSQARRLRYLLAPDGTTVAKVKEADLGPLLKSPTEFRDRTILRIPTRQIERLTLKLKNEFGPQPMEVTFARQAPRTWSLTSPVESEIQNERLLELVRELGQLQAVAVVADEGDPAAYGLDDPDALITFVEQPPPAIRAEPGPSGEDGEPGQMTTVEVPSDPIEHRVAVSLEDNVCYAQVRGKPTIFRVQRSFYERLFVEYRLREILSFNEQNVERFEIRHGEQAHAFVRDGDTWQYETEPDLPLDQAAVTNLLLQLGDLKTDRFAACAMDESFGLDQPSDHVTIVLPDQPALQLSVSATQCSADPNHGHYAMVAGRPGVFLLSPDTLGRFQVALDKLIE
jgi:hypothetical protein